MLASTLLHEQGWPHEHIELQLAHAPRNAVSAAYNHALYLEPRAKMMQHWSDFLEQTQRGGKVRGYYETQFTGRQRTHFWLLSVLHECIDDFSLMEKANWQLSLVRIAGFTATCRRYRSISQESLILLHPVKTQGWKTKRSIPLES
jgi:hypothetical protein